MRAARSFEKAGTCSLHATDWAGARQSSSSGTHCRAWKLAHAPFLRYANVLPRFCSARDTVSSERFADAFVILPLLVAAEFRNRNRRLNRPRNNGPPLLQHTVYTLAMVSLNPEVSRHFSGEMIAHRCFGRIFGRIFGLELTQDLSWFNVGTDVVQHLPWWFGELDAQILDLQCDLHFDLLPTFC